MGEAHLSRYGRRITRVHVVERPGILMTFPEAPKIFGIYSKWLYKRVMYSPDVPYLGLKLVHMYFLGRKLQETQFCPAVLEAFLEKIYDAGGSVMDSSTTMNTLYNTRTLGSCVIRRLIPGVCAWM